MTRQGKPQADRHSDIPVSFRLDPDLKEPLKGHLALTGKSRQAFINELIRKELDRETPAG